MSSDEVIQMILSTRDEGILHRFWKKVNKTDTCWLWTAGVTHNGYARFGVDTGMTVRSNRLSYALANNKMPGEVVRHTCNNPLCVNPEHLIDGTQLDNVKDRVEQGRSRQRFDYDSCLHGHKYAETGFYINSANGYKMCKACILKSNSKRSFR